MKLLCLVGLGEEKVVGVPQVIFHLVEASPQLQRPFLLKRRNLLGFLRMRQFGQAGENQAFGVLQLRPLFLLPIAVLAPVAFVAHFAVFPRLLPLGLFPPHALFLLNQRPFCVLEEEIRFVLGLPREVQEEVLVLQSEGGVVESLRGGLVGQRSQAGGGGVLVGPLLLEEGGVRLLGKEIFVQADGVFLVRVSLEGVSVNILALQRTPLDEVREGHFVAVPFPRHRPSLQREGHFRSLLKRLVRVTGVLGAGLLEIGFTSEEGLGLLSAVEVGRGVAVGVEFVGEFLFFRLLALFKISHIINYKKLAQQETKI